MKNPALLLVCALVAGCATPPPAIHPAMLFSDELFAPPSARISAAEVFAVSPEMKRFIGSEMALDLRTKGAQRGLIEALYTRGRLKLEYDSALTLGNVDDAYWWARDAMAQDPAHFGAYNTHGAVYLRHGNAREAERVLAHVLARDPENLEAMANLVPALRAQGRGGEADALALLKSGRM